MCCVCSSFFPGPVLVLLPPQTSRSPRIQRGSLQSSGLYSDFPSPQLSDLVALVRGKLSRMQRAVLSALIVIEVHAKDVVNKLIVENVVSVHDFEWISQLR